ncbi:MAG: lysine 2,3-aminomutase [Proteobacteria bacterium]|nr:lysine 2,3-aminomutase [Pseudomonadota bacterium]NDC24333.1 lysine 2,3-aminomutase [Pseudomonadota bacterium]NDD04356.1 lysine 2,3-aminomutase [Pseudomonadota bacterium]NDG26751.1 lysine 2,3-aminomutase [Pseudomonadota bacterium]
MAGKIEFKKEVAKSGKVQPYPYQFTRDFVEPDWRRLPGYKNVTQEEWESALWQKRNLVKNTQQLKQVFGDLITDHMLLDIQRDQQERATMALLVPPQMINTMNEKELQTDPVRRYMLPFFSERDRTWASHPKAGRDSLHEAEMWVVEGLTHRYPTKVLAELLSTCPQYCGHCTRMDLVGTSVPQVPKRKFEHGQKDRLDAILEYLQRTPSVRDVVVSGGDIANLPAETLEGFVSRLLDIDNIRDIRLASKGLMGIPQHFLQDEVLKALDRIAKKAVSRGVNLALHTHVNSAQSVTPLVAKAARKLLNMGFRDVRNQGVLLRGVNDSQKALLDLCFRLQDHGNILPYYFYMCDMIPNSEHWRISVAQAQQLQHDIMGYLPGFATPRIVCDVPFVGKRWVHQVHSYDKEKGISRWTKNYLTSIEWDNPEALNQLYEYFDPIDTLPEAGKKFWEQEAANAN